MKKTLLGFPPLSFPYTNVKILKKKFWRAFQTRPTLETFQAVREPLFFSIESPSKRRPFRLEKIDSPKKERLLPFLLPWECYASTFIIRVKACQDGTLPLPRHKATLFSLILACIVVGRLPIKGSKISNTSVQMGSG